MAGYTSAQEMIGKTDADILKIALEFTTEQLNEFADNHVPFEQK